MDRSQYLQWAMSQNSSCHMKISIVYYWNMKYVDTCPSPYG